MRVIVKQLGLVLGMGMDEKGKGECKCTPSPLEGGEGYQKLINFLRMSQSGQVKTKIEDVYPNTLCPTTLYLTELDNSNVGLVLSRINESERNTFPMVDFGWSSYPTVVKVIKEYQKLSIKVH